MPNSNSFTHRLLFFSREATSETTAPGFLLHYICLCDLFSFAFIFGSIKPKIQKYLATLYFIWHSIYQYFQLSHVRLPISRSRCPKGIDNPFNTSGCEYLLLSAGAVHIVLRGSPTCSITLVSSLREIPTVDVLHHPFLFGEIPM